MNWLKEHVYLAAWLALPVMIIIALIQGRQSQQVAGKGELWPLKKVLAYLLFLICFPLSMTPWAEDNVRMLSGVLAWILLAVILITPNKSWNS
jgi:Na+-translocating ferredoxin:NAD+ oxidoreductase RnfD subunit